MGRIQVFLFDLLLRGMSKQLFNCFDNELRLSARELTCRHELPCGMNCATAHKGAIQFMERSEKSWQSQIMRKAQIIPLEDQHE
ncbi:MAG: hypothetical protein K5756_03895 [Clostridiales bacterium]|nr:hypothetical protein [Clostridiales bacterium]